MAKVLLPRVDLEVPAGLSGNVEVEFRFIRTQIETGKPIHIPTLTSLIEHAQGNGVSAQVVREHLTSIWPVRYEGSW